MDCIFCKIVNGHIPSYKLYEDDEILAFLDINPTSVGHTLIIPKKHTLDIMTIGNDTFINIVNKSRDIAKLISEKLNATGFSLTQNNGKLQEVKHFHLHIIPCYDEKKDLSIEEVFNILTK